MRFDKVSKSSKVLDGSIFECYCSEVWLDAVELFTMESKDFDFGISAKQHFRIKFQYQ